MTVDQNFAIFAFVLVASLHPGVAQAQSATEWVSDFMNNHAQAKAHLLDIFENVQKLAVEHYKSTKDLPRASFIATMQPDVDALADKVALAKFQDRANETTTPVEKIIQRYIVETSAGASAADNDSAIKTPVAQAFCAQTSQAWFQQLNVREDEAQKDLIACFEAVRAEARDHYTMRGDTKRATIIENMHPDFRSLLIRMAAAKIEIPTFPIRDVIRGYLIDASAAQLPAQLKK